MFLKYVAVCVLCTQLFDSAHTRLIFFAEKRWWGAEEKLKLGIADEEGERKRTSVQINKTARERKSDGR